MKILGDIRPVTNQPTSYTMVTNAGVPVKVNQWIVYHKNRLLTENNRGVFTFGINTANLPLKLVAKVRDPKTDKLVDFHIEIKPLAGRPKILDLYWQDINGDKIQDREVAYLDKVTLVVKTQNIPQGDTLKITIYEDEYEDGHGDSSRNMGEYQTKGITKNGYAYLELNNMKLYQSKLNKMDYVDEGVHEFYAKVYYYYDKINEIKDSIQLKVKNTLQQMVQPYSGNKPVVVGKVDSIQKSKKPVNFTFGVFIDGTLNNMYNTEMKQKLDGKKDLKNTNGLNRNLSSYDFKEIYKDYGDPDYGESSYENDLSNPAILFKNYIKEVKNRQFRIYTEGVGTHSASKEQGADLQKKDYKGDDIMEGPAFGMGNAGIKDKVRKSIDDVVKEIKRNIDKGKEYPDTITFDIFGLSRGAAAARHFVNVVTHPIYQISDSEAIFDAKDKFGYPVKYDYLGKMMPPFGYLGQLLKESKLLDAHTKIKVRFVGIYDTVPHHGMFQSNDIKDLGLNDVNKADYVVHMVAADEYRANFDLVDISSVAKVSAKSGEKGGIELTYPGVHCDVGGAYVEGGSNRCYRLNVSKHWEPLEKEKEEFIKEGWFKEDELSVKAMRRRTKYRLEGYKKNVSNQYSYIPLHIMRQFCTIKKVPINVEKLIKFKHFTGGHIKFLEGVKKTLWDYSFNNGKPLTFENGNDNEVIKNLRYHYLHWNSTYGDPEEAFGTWISGKNHPNMIKGKRKRNVH